MSVTVCAFYKFVDLTDCTTLQAELATRGETMGIKGTILLAREGINATISGSPAAMAAFLADLRSDSRFTVLTVKQATADDHPFQRLKVKVKREIIAFDPTAEGPLAAVGTYVKPQDWNALIADPDVVVIDTRNAYEVAIGTFDRAIDPKTAAFSDFPAYAKANLDSKRDKKIAMFCTGGIRCEKASAHLIQMGFEEVYHLEGGILNYLEAIPPQDSRWQGECFVFDERVSVTHGNLPGTHTLCPNCGFPVAISNAQAQCTNCETTESPSADHDR